MKRAFANILFWLDEHIFDCRWHWLCNYSEALWSEVEGYDD